MNDFREFSDYLMHYGRKGMHWGKHLPGIEEQWKNNVTGSNYKRAVEGSQRERANAIRDIQSGSDRDWYNGHHGGSYADYRKENPSDVTTYRMNRYVSAKADVSNMNRDIAWNREQYKKSIVGRVESALDKVATKINNIDTEVKKKGKSICDSILKKFGFQKNKKGR